MKQHDQATVRRCADVQRCEFVRANRFIQAFLDFLHCANDEANLRVLFERVLKVLPASQAKEVWNRFMTFEGAFGSDSAMMVRILSRL